LIHLKIQIKLPINMTKAEGNQLKEECISYILSIPNVNWKRSESILTWITSCKYDKPHEEYQRVPSWEEEDGRDCHIVIRLGLDDTDYDSINETKYNGLYVSLERYSFKSYEWDRVMGFVVTSLEQFKSIIKSIIKTNE